MKLFRVIMYIYLWLIVGFMLLMSFDAFDVTSSWDEQFLGFIIHFLPGLMLGAALLLMKKKIRYYAFWAIGFFYLFLYNPFGNIRESWYIIVFIILPVLVSGAINVEQK